MYLLKSPKNVCGPIIASNWCQLEFKNCIYKEIDHDGHNSTPCLSVKMHPISF